MTKFLTLWLAAGTAADLLFLAECWIMHAGMAGKALQASFARETRFPGKPAAIAAACLFGLLFPPYVIAGLIYFASRLRQERARLRRHGRG
jgi:hypothetical protein